MSDIEQSTSDVEVSAQASAPGELSIEDALQGVLRNALVHNGLARGIREAVKALSSGQAQVCVLVESVTEASYLKLIEALCNEPEQSIPLIKVADPKKLGQWVGLFTTDRDGNPRKVVGCSCAVIRDWGVDSEERSALLNFFESE